jgi:alanine racemase
MTRPTKAEIILPALRHNLSLAREQAQGAELIPVVKADAYGHGAVAVSAELVKNGIKNLAVACLEEACELRDAGLAASLILLGPMIENEIREIVSRNLVPVISCPEDLSMIEKGLKALSARKDQKRLEVIVDVDTGMGRMGFLPEQVAGLFEGLRKLPQLKVIGIFSHLPVSESADEEDLEYTSRQLQDFNLIAEAAKKALPEMPKLSIANSGALLLRRDAAMSAARPGIMLYGVRPECDLPVNVSLEPVMRWVTEIVQVRSLPRGSCISYGRKTVLKRSSRLALLPVGYADGLNRRIPPGFNLIVRGRPAPICGVITMDLTMIDVTDIPEARPGDRVLIMGRDMQGTQVQVSAEDHARAAGAIPYEILTAVGRRVKRVVNDE